MTRLGKGKWLGQKVAHDSQLRDGKVSLDGGQDRNWRATWLS